MNFKKTFSIIMALILLINVLAPCFQAEGTETPEHVHTLQYDSAQHWGTCSCDYHVDKTAHTYGDWQFDTQKGMQSRSCTVCGYEDILYGTNTKVSQVTDPVVGESYYLAANAGGTVHFFVTGASVTDTVPYSLHTATDLSHTGIKQIIPEAPVEGTTGFQLSFYNGSTLTRIYCYDVKTDGSNRGVMDTGTNTANFINRHTFFVDEVDGVQVLRKIGNDNVLVVKYNETKGTWRMLGVPESELSNAGVYPAMLVKVHTHSFDSAYAYNEDGHWRSCACGAAQEPEDHEFVLDEALGYAVCQCGADQKPHECASEDGKWYASATQHYQLCDGCGKPFNESGHTYGSWSFDAQAGSQSRSCSVCNYADTLLGTDNKVSPVAEPAVGGSYYLAANAKGVIHYFVLQGSVTETNPYSLSTTTDFNHAALQKISLEAPISGEDGFQITVIRQSDNKLLRIYCYDAGGSDGIMDTGTNAGSDLEKHTFTIDEVNGVKVLRKIGNNNVLVVKYNETKGAWRMLGVPESELAGEGVYPAVLVEAHTHQLGEAYEYDENGHWKGCSCGYATTVEKHSYIMDETLGYLVCSCGASLENHDCASSDGAWYEEAGKHYQLCGLCGKRIQEQTHTYGQWVFDTVKGTQERACSVCNHSQILLGTQNKVSPVAEPVVGGSYYLAANENGVIRYFVLQGSVTETNPYSLNTTTDFNHASLRQVTLEAPFSGDTGFQITVVRPSDDMLLRIYCYDAGGSDGIMDTGTNTGKELEKHTFTVDEVNGVKVLRKLGNNNILVLKYFASADAWRILGVPESELDSEGVFPVVLAQAHTHSFGESFEYDGNAHWKRCDCGYTSTPETHSFQLDEALGYEVCQCGVSVQPHDCESADGVWYQENGKHYQLCGICHKQINLADHTFGPWSYDTENGTQSHSCVCGYTESLWGENTKVSLVSQPVIGSSHYLAANVDGTVWFFRHGAVTDTMPYSLVVTDNVNHNWAFPVTVEAPIEGSEGFQFTYVHPTSGATTRIYCYDAGGSDGIMDTGVNSGNEWKKHTFAVDEVNGVQVLRKLSNDSILVVKYNETVGAWRMLGVPESELANEGVYPVMLADVHTHSFDGYSYDKTGHWKACSCGLSQAVEPHNYVMNEALGYQECLCGATLMPHDCVNTDGKWYGSAENHYQRCDVCYAKINVAKHKYGAWSFDAEAGTQSQKCRVCRYENVLYGTNNKVSQVDEPVIGGSYYLAANVKGTVQFFRHGTVTETVPYSLVATDNPNHDWTFPVTLEAPVEGTTGFQLTYVNPTTQSVIRIYCYDAGGSDGIMDTGVNSGSELKKHTFTIDEVNGVKVLRKLSNQNILVAKYFASIDAWRILGVPESELAGAEVYPVMLSELHTHKINTQKYSYDKTGHWHACDCGVAEEKESHSYVLDEKLGYKVCKCGATVKPHTCQNKDGKWYEADGKHYQYCDICYDKINVANHKYKAWRYDTENGTQSQTCKVCRYENVLYGTTTKVSPVDAPVIGGSYYLAANVKGTVQFFRHGTVTETVPYSLVATDNANHDWTFPVTLESPAEGTVGFQLTYLNPTTQGILRIYCYDANVDGENAGVMDTGVNSGNELKKHTFTVDEVGGVKVLRKLSNNNILVVKYFASIDAWRILGVPESELAGGDVYPVMLTELHSHRVNTQKYDYDKTGHWHACDCGIAEEKESHSYVLNEKLGYLVCKCGSQVKPHTCQNKDGKWYEADGKHYQHCDICYDKINVADHVYTKWKFDKENSTQTQKCKVCGYVHLLHGTETKVSPVYEPVIGGSYYLAANVDGIIQFFRHGTVTETVPYSLVTTDNVNHDWAFQVTLEAPAEGKVGFQLTYTNPSTQSIVRIYCYDVNVEGENAGVMDTGVNSGSELKKHTFTVDEVNGVKVLRKLSNNNILAVKYFAAIGAWRMLGVAESELAKEGVYPVVLANLHEHSHTDTTYLSDTSGHWFACECGGKSAYEAHKVPMWEITVPATETTAGSKTGVCIVCGATAIKEIPPSLPDGIYYLSGELNGQKYYFRDKSGTESVEHTTPFSLYTTTQKDSAQQVDIIWNEDANTYNISYFAARKLNIYMGDVNGSTIAMDGKVDLSSSATTSAALIDFTWDPVNRNLYQMEGSVKYVMAFKRLTNTSTNQKEIRLLAVPETELGADTAVVRFEVIHQHSYNLKWSYDAIYHWQECECGARKYEAEHTVPEWTVDREATQYTAGSKSGICTICGEKIVNAIPMLNDHVHAPVNGAKYYLTAVLNGTRYYFRHAPSGGSVTTTTPYSLYTDTEKSNAITVKQYQDVYLLSYGTSGYHIYINGTGTGTTTKSEDSALVDFLWDEENKLLYQDEGGVKYVLVFRFMQNYKTGAMEVRITGMPMEQALIDPTVALAQFSTQGPAPKEDERLLEADRMPADATPLKDAPAQTPVDEIVYQDDAIAPKNPMSSEQTADEGDAKSILPAVLISAAILAVLVVVLILLSNTKFGAAFFGKWNVWTAVSFVAAAVVLVAGMLLITAPKTEEPSLAEFTIVANAGNLDTAEELAVTIYEEYGISLPVVQSKDYNGNMGIYLDTQGLNSYGGYKYSVYAEDGEYGPGVYINGSGPSLDTAISKWLKSVKDTSAFPFGLKESISGYEWNTDDINMTGLGFTMEGMERTELCEGVELRKLSYNSFGYGKVTGYAVIVESDAQVELKVAAGAWDENTNPDNPGEKHTVGDYGKMLTEDGYEVLAITNAGFYDLNTTMTYIPWGLQIVDGYVKKEPSEENPNNTDNWFAQTADGKYVISDTAGYFETYETTLAQGVGGGRVLMENGKPCFSTTGADYRTVVGITKGGDLIILTMPSANYAFVAQIYMDMDLDVDCILNLDGGGSTTLHAQDEYGKLTRLVCETPIEREVADAIAIVKKK